MSAKENFRQPDFLSSCSELQIEENDSQFCVIVCSTKEELEQLHCKKALDPQYTCNLCGKKYSSQSILNVHKIRHKKKDDLPFQCMFCSYKSAAKRDLLRHHNQHIGHARPVYKCHLCPKMFKINSSLNEHIKSVHTKETTYRCGKCDFTTERRSTFRIHLDTHDESQVKIICPFCGSYFRNKSNLKNHLLTHADAKPFLCNQCNQRFTLKNRLIAHQQAVHGPKTFVCKTCEKSFPSIHRLNRHSLIHSGVRPFKCCFCPHTSNTQGNLMKHVRKVHAMFDFTYNDILIERGLKVDPQNNLTDEELQKLVDFGRECSESHLKQLRTKGYTSSSMEQLQQNTHCKKEAQANLIRKMREKAQNAKKPKEGKEKIKAPSKNKNKVERKKEKSAKGISEGAGLSTCEDLILPRMNDSNYILHSSNGAIDGMDGLPMTPAIHVIWHVSSDNNAKTKPVSVRKKKLKASPKSSRNLKEKEPKNKSENTSRSVTSGHDTSLPPSPMLEDRDHLTFTDKPPMLNQFSSTNPGLSTTLDNLHEHLVDLEGIEPPNVIVGSNDGINDFDGMCKNLDLYNQFLPMNDEGPFMNAIDCSTCKEAEKTTLSKDNLDFKVRDSDVKEKLASSQLVISEQISTSSSFSHHRSRLKSKSNSKPLSMVVSNQHQLENYKVDPTNGKFKSTKDSSCLSDIFQIAIKHSRDLIDNHTKSANCGQLIDVQKGLDLLTPEEVIVLQNNNDQISMKLLPKSQSRKDLYNEPVREIVIKNSISCFWLPNDQMDIMSIAEVEKRDRDVVLIIDTLD